MRTLATLLALTLLLLAALVTFAPAALLDARLDAATQGYLRLTDTMGTVWKGRGLVTNKQRTWSLPVSWDVDPLALARGDLAIRLDAPSGGDLPRGTFARRNAALNLDGVAFALPAAALNGTMAPADTMALGGTLAFDAPHLTWNGRGGDGAATLRWSGARAAANAATLALGTVTVNFAPREGGIQGRIENHGGDARIDGEMTLGSEGIGAGATLAPLPSTPPAAMRALAALGTPDASGAVRVQWRSSDR
jgi:hypothetical protein